MTRTKMTIRTMKMTTVIKSLMMGFLARKKKIRMRKKKRTLKENSHLLATCIKKKRIKLT